MKVLRLDDSRPWVFERAEQLKQVGKTCFLQKQTVKYSSGLIRENITVWWSVEETFFIDGVNEKRGVLFGKTR